MRSYLYVISKIYIPLLLFAGSILSGVVGYVVIENYSWLDALYMTSITVSTVGFTEVHPLSSTGRVFTIFLILFNISIFTYFITVVSRFVFDGEFIQSYKAFKMKEALNEIRDHVIVCGFGRNGREAASVLYRNKIPFVVVEMNADKFENADFPLTHRMIADATKDEILLEAGIDRARSLICAMPNDADNVFVVLTARDLNRKITIISRASDYTSVRKLKIAGANNVIMPDTIGGAHMAMLTLMPDVKEFIDLLSTQMSDNFQIAELIVDKNVSLVDLDAWRTTGATVLGVKTIAGDYILNPAPAVQLHTGDRLILMGALEQIRDVSKKIGVL
ncbi:potassium channel family protein [Xanthocytophaga agilis]|uniref:NAD-binding protein n=1 Tax=Xanthocytophaga agilis TaxID=3048010 RepID=A0AAE3QYN7_9BACT|nr:NAD-binding protein [Xanthocytophaga agilis]MDJ1500531.1 NAD-binding protein [Xanthocytophaga agilis]